LKKTGVLQPILVRGSGDKYELIAGERRWRAAIKAGLEKVPVIVKNVADEQAMIMALVENLQERISILLRWRVLASRLLTVLV